MDRAEGGGGGGGRSLPSRGLTAVQLSINPVLTCLRSGRGDHAVTQHASEPDCIRTACAVISGM